MPALQTAMGPLNQRFGPGMVGDQELNHPDVFAEGIHLADLVQEQDYVNVGPVIAYLRDHYGLPRRRACRLVRLHRSTSYYRSIKDPRLELRCCTSTLPRGPSRAQRASTSTEPSAWRAASVSVISTRWWTTWADE